MKSGFKMREGLTMWGAICYKGPVCIEGVTGKTDAGYYTTILKEGLFPAAYPAMEDIWALKKDNDPI